MYIHTDIGIYTHTYWGMCSKIFTHKMYNPKYLGIIELGISNPQNLVPKKPISLACLDYS